MTAAAIRDALRQLEARGAISSWWEKSNGTMVVVLGTGPNVYVRTKADMDALVAILLKKAAT